MGSQAGGCLLRQIKEEVGDIGSGSLHGGEEPVLDDLDRVGGPL